MMALAKQGFLFFGPLQACLKRGENKKPDERSE
jgi:hypothetical protein